MFDQDLQELTAGQRGPCLTITLPTHRTTPDNKQDPIRLDNLVRSAHRLVQDELAPAEAERLLVQLNGLVRDVAHQQNLDGMALFVQPDRSRLLRLPVPVAERVTLGEHYRMQELVRALNRIPTFVVLVIADQATRLFHGAGDQLTEHIDAQTFPYENTTVGSETLRTNDSAVNTALHHDQHQRVFLREVDRRLAQVIGTTRPMILLIGVEKNLALFAELTRHNELIAATMTGSAGRVTVTELLPMIQPALEAALADRRAEALSALARAEERGRHMTTLAACLQAARAGRVDRLLVEEEYHEALPLGANGEVHVVEDGVDLVISEVLHHGGTVTCVAPETLAAQQRIAAVLRS